ncbi:uncharacterized protein LOC117586174 [Drosophila guanche]|uniref:Chitin-binding type-4 domain-containing protein n=1 Tax=Drosophila guanche TaxID=7266 RepID=A0A3B0JPD2_DROGU|nr:uncharacterized protein LOC117586174 [Drosophila guanche]SPP83985.1 Hypothetical predicted protein [Drosophila guanche]
MKYFDVILTLSLGIFCLVDELQGHGMMLDPVGRSSRWRYDSSAPKNYDDNGLYCGGLWKQTENAGRCGLCGDDWSMEQPRPNELGGKYGSGVIVRTFAGKSEAEIKVKITANHLGYFTFHLCSLDEYGTESEECFNKIPLKFADGNLKYNISSRTGDIPVTLQLPTDLNCVHCVLRWTYTAGNNWGVCENGKGAMGCGAQETFKNCADISVLSAARSLFPEVPVEVVEDA